MKVWPFGVALQGEASNHLVLRWLTTVVVSDEETEGPGEILVREHRTEYFPDPDGQRPLGERGPHHPSRQLRHSVIRPRLQRHPALPIPPTTIAISKTN